VCSSDLSGLWIHRDVAKVLDDKEHENMRIAFHAALFNMRGTFTWTAGKEEERLAAGFSEKAEALDKEGFYTLGATMREMASSYKYQAKREAERDPYED
jgi:hypothetical protein